MEKFDGLPLFSIQELGGLKTQKKIRFQGQNASKTEFLRPTTC